MATRLMMVVLWAAAVGAASSSSSSDAIPTLQLPTFTLSQLEDPDAAALKVLGRVARELGLFAVTQTSSTSTTSTSDALGAYVRCFSDQHLEGSTVNVVQLSDGTVRRTLATSSVGDAPSPLPQAVQDACPRFAAAAKGLRATISRVGRAYARILDRLVYANATSAADPNLEAGPFLSAATSAESLEHFQLFLRPSSAPGAAASASSEAASAASRRALQQAPHHGAATRSTTPASTPTSRTMLPMHSDVGMFLVMTAAEVYDLRSGEHLPVEPRQQSLLLELPSGQVVRPLVPGGSLLVMNGEGSNLWMPEPPRAAQRLWAPAHEVGAVEGLDGKPWARTWVGRMYLPPAGAQPRAMASSALEGNMTFAEFRQRTNQAFRGLPGADGQARAVLQPGGVHREAVLGDLELAAAGCSPSRRLLADEGSCAADEAYCWMSCMKIKDTSCGKASLQCVNPAGKLWPADYMVNGKPTHCSTCTLQCPASPASTSGNGTSSSGSHSGFCNTDLEPTTMWMDGFRFVQGADTPCVVYLFPEWVLDTRVKFAFATIGTFFVAVLTGGLTRARVVLRAAWPTTIKASAAGGWGSGNPRAWAWTGHTLLVMLAAIQLCLGYFLMLLTMTYQAELFIAVVLGLAVGVLFSILEVGGAGDSSNSSSSAAASSAEETKGLAAGGAAAYAGGYKGDHRQANDEEEQQKLDPCCAC